MKLFQRLADYNQIDSWVPLLDWLLSNDRFSKQKGWDANKKRRFTSRVKKFSGIGKENWRIQVAKNATWEFEKTDCIQIVMNNGGSEGESFVKHIRNGIAHGSTQIVKLKEVLYLDIKDYQDDNHQKQTAHIWIPIDFLFETYRLYIEIEKNTPQINKQCRNRASKIADAIHQVL